MKLASVTKLYKSNKTTSKKKKKKKKKKMAMASKRQIVTSLSIFLFKENLEQSRNLILEAWSAKLILSLIITFYPTKTENRTKNFLTQLLIWVKVLFLTKNADSLPKNADINKVKKVLILRHIFFKTKYVCVLTYQISSF